MPKWKLEETMSEDHAQLSFLSDDGASWSLVINSMAADELGTALINFSNGETYNNEGDIDGDL